MIDSIGVDTSTTMRASVVTDDAGFDALAAEWDELLEQSDQRVFFLRFSWNRLWWRILRPPDSQLYLVCCRDERNKLVGLAPFYLRQRRTAGILHARELLFLGTGVYAQTSEYLDVIARRGYEKLVAKEIVGYLRRCDDWDQLTLREIPESSAMLSHLVSALGEAVQIESCNRSYFVDTTVDWETYTNSLSHSGRQNVIRRTRKFFSLHQSKLRRLKTADELEPAIDALVRLHQARWQSRGEPGTFALPGVEEFLKESMRVSLEDDRLGLTTLEVDGSIAAVRLDFVDNRVAHAFQAGFDPAYARQSLGHVMSGLCIRAYIEDDRVDEYDLMAGNAAYKESWTKNFRDSVCLNLARPGARSSAYKGIETVKVIGKSLLRKTVPESIRIAGHRLITQRHYK